MTLRENMTRRALLVKLGIVFNACVAALLAIPILRYLLSPAVAGGKSSYRNWLSLGSVEQFPEGQTRFATFTNPDVQPWDGKTAQSACWVRRIDATRLQVFAINCAHLGGPVRWFPDSSFARVMAEPTTKTARALPVLPSEGFSSIRTRLKMEPY